MKVSEVRFLKSVSINTKEVYFEEKPEIIFVGRSNVGKSSLMNSIFGKKDLVKTSSTPGKTRTANIFLLNKKYFFTDLPGYGFAKLGKTFKDDLDSLISWYIEEKKSSIKCVIVLIDSRIGPQDTDLDMYQYLLDIGLEAVFVITKIDKLGNSDIKQSLMYAEKQFFGQNVFAVSTKSGVGVKELFKYITEKMTNNGKTNKIVKNPIL